MSIRPVIIKTAVSAITNIVRKAYWAYDIPSEFFKMLMWGAAVVFSIFTARALLLLTGAALMGAIIFILMHSITLSSKYQQPNQTPQSSE